MNRPLYPREIFNSPAVAEATPAGPGLAFWLGHLRLAEPQRAHGLDVWPLLLDGAPGEPFVLLHQALEAGTFEVLEQVGVIALANDGLLGLELIGHPDSWTALGRRLMPSYLMAAELARDPRRPAAGPRHGAREWLARVAGARVTSRPSRGLGEQLALEGPAFAGAGLWHEERPAHLVVFAD